MNKEEFIFMHLDEVDEHKDYWFKVTGNTKEELTNTYMEQSMIEVSEVVYSKDEDLVGIKRLFPFNYNVVISEDKKLKEILKELSDENRVLLGE